MNKEMLVREIVRRTGVRHDQSLGMTNALMDIVTETLGRGDRLVLANFGVLRPVRRASRTAKNPISGVQYNIPVRFDVKFTPSEYLKLSLNEALKSEGVGQPVEIVVARAEKRIQGR